MLRHLPPAAPYLPLAALRQGLAASPRDVARFGEGLASYLGVRACFLASSGRTALFLLFKALAAARPLRRLILLPAYTCPALVQVILDAGLQPCLVDISPETLAFDLDQLARQLDERALAVIAVHPFGIPQRLDLAASLAKRAGAVLIEDAAQALGARWHENPVGSQGDFGLFSLGPGKPLSLAGGGAVCTNDAASAHLLRQTFETLPPPTAADSAGALARLLAFRLATHPRAWWLFSRAGPERWGSHPSSRGYALRPMSAAQGRIGLRLLPELDELNRLRRENAGRLAARLQGLDFVHIPGPERAAEAVYLRLPLILDTRARRERLHRALQRAGIGAGRMYRYSLPEIFPELEPSPWHGAEQVAGRLLTLPTHHYLTFRDIDRIEHIFRAAS